MVEVARAECGDGGGAEQRRWRRLTMAAVAAGSGEMREERRGATERAAGPGAALFKGRGGGGVEEGQGRRRRCPWRPRRRRYRAGAGVGDEGGWAGPGWLAGPA